MGGYPHAAEDQSRDDASQWQIHAMLKGQVGDRHDAGGGGKNNKEGRTPTKPIADR